MGRLSPSKPFSLFLAGLAAAAGIVDSVTVSAKQIAAANDPHVFDSCKIGSLFDCAKVDSSRYAWFAGVPVGLYGIMFYTAALTIVLLLFSGFVLPKWQRTGISIVIALSLLFSYRLAFFSYFGVGSICLYCAISYVLNTLLAVFWYRYAWIVSRQLAAPPE